MNKRSESSALVRLALSILLMPGSPAMFASAFKGAVFEHAVVREADSGRPEEIVRANLEYYQAAARAASSKGADVIVFPEYGLFPPARSRVDLKPFLEQVPDPRQTRANPCAARDAFSARPILLTLSCLARETSMYLVANMGDAQPCRRHRDCPEDGSFCFNTNVVFARDGSVVTKYHKEHLYTDTGMDVPPPAYRQDPTFETDLGRFVTFVCFDLIFQRAVPQQWEGVRAVLFPTMWLNTCPLYSSMQFFQSWSVGNEVPLLAANVHLPGGAAIGSGIVNGSGGALVYTFNPDGKSKLLVADLLRPEDRPAVYLVTPNGTQEWTEDGKDVESRCSRKVLGPSEDMLKDYRCFERDLSTFALAKLEKNSGSLHLCNEGLCCSLEYEAEEILESYVMGVSNGSYNASNGSAWPEEECFLARCDSMGDKTCVTFPTQTRTRFRFLRLEANFSTDFVYPSVVTSRMRLAPRGEWDFEKGGDRVAAVTFEDGQGKEVLVVGLKARPYDRDPPDDVGSATSNSRGQLSSAAYDMGFLVLVLVGTLL